MNKSFSRFQIGLTTAAMLAVPALAFAWTSAPSSPPAGNVSAPLNAGDVVQTKSNYLFINTADHDVGFLVTGSTATKGKVGIGAASPDAKLTVGENGDGSAVKASGFYYSSDARFKNNVTTISDALSKVLNLRGVSFTWKTTGKNDVGVIAQEVEKVFPDVVNTDPTGLKSVEYGHLIGPLIEAIKAQQAQIDALKAEVAALKAR